MAITRIKDSGGKDVMTERIEIPINPSEDMARELVELVSRCYMENPDMEDLRELENYLKEQPQLYQEVFNLTKIVQDKLIENIIPLICLILL